MKHSLLKLENLRTFFHTDIGVVKAVDGLDVEIEAGEIIGMLVSPAVGNP